LGASDAAAQRHEIEDWHDTLLKTGARNGGPLSARTVGHAHRVLHRALQRAVESEVLARNVSNSRAAIRCPQ